MVNNIIRFYFTLAVLLIFGFSAYAQTKLSGNVTDGNDKSPLVGANVYVKSINKGVTTDLNGNFLALNAGEFLELKELLSLKPKKQELKFEHLLTKNIVLN